MELSNTQLESIVRRVLGEMAGGAPRAAASVPKTAKVATLTAPKKIEVKEFPIPTVGDNDILVKVEGCGVCGTDVHEWKGDPFGIIPVTLGHEGTGEIIALGKNGGSRIEIRTNIGNHKVTIKFRYIFFCSYISNFPVYNTYHVHHYSIWCEYFPKFLDSFL